MSSSSNNRWETRLRDAKPTNDEIAPLSPEASSRILSAALRANRRTHRAPFWLAVPFRVVVGSAATAAFAYFLMPRVDFSELPAESTAVPTVSAPGETEAVAASRIPQAAKSLPKPSSLPTLPSVLPQPVAPRVLLARDTATSPPRPTRATSAPSWGSRKAARTVALARQAKPAVSVSEGVEGRSPKKSATASPRFSHADEGNMYVSVTGDSVLPPESETEDGLTVTVRRDVPNSESGSAEAAALHAVPVPSATPDPADAQSIPVWTHVRVETGAEPVLTLTALH